MKATIDDVAKRAGVSIKTVSRVLNKEPNVRVETGERVLAAIEALDYRPNPSARGLAGDRSFMLGLVHDRRIRDYIAEVQYGAILRCQEEGFLLVVEIWREDENLVSKVDAIIDRSRVDGVILTPPMCDNHVVLAALEARAAPFVRISPRIDNRNDLRVAIDDRRAAYELTQRLLNIGHRRIGFIKGAEGHSATNERFAGYCDAMKTSGASVKHNLIKQGDFTFQSGAACAERLFAQKERPSAIFASNDDMAAAVVIAARQRNIRIPEELSVVGFDDAPIATAIWPPLTTVRQPVAEIAATAASMLIKTVRSRALPTDPADRSATLDFVIVERGSTAPPPISSMP